MTRPQIVRADTIDLQSPESPSAKDHTRQPTHPGPLGDGPPAPHQAIALKNAEQEVEFHTRSPRMSQDLSNKELQLLHEDSDDSTNATGSDPDHHNLQRNGISNGATGEDMDMGDSEGDDGLDDDMMDKISSSPSIEDGGYNLLFRWPHRDDSLVMPQEDAVSPPPKQETFSPSPSLSPPVHFPLLYPQKELALDPSKDHHHKGEYIEELPGLSFVEEESEIDSPNDHAFRESGDTQGCYDDDFDSDNLYNLLVPANDSLLDNSFDDAPLSPTESASSSDDQPMSEYDDDTKDISYSDDSRFIDSGWGGECLRETEDIDFDFVYALHTFVATVEGQANATKGDTMVLLDDTNSYWWLVRVVKDGSIGYLPAEHIETPTERLARLNKHRNIDLSQSMLGDNPEKSKNPLKKAMRRRNGKTVQFAAPTYRDPPPMDYSTEEEEDEDGDAEHATNEEGSNETQNGEREKEMTENTTVEPLAARGQENENDASEPKGSLDSRDTDDQSTVAENERSSDETLERSDDGVSARSRRGTVRNTDSFFKDDNLETRKINLTPSLLRDDSSGSTIKSNEVRETKPRGSIDSLEKPQSPLEKTKEEKKRKEKKGRLGSLFKRKDRKNRGQDDENEDGQKLSEELLSESPQPKESLESLSQETQAAKPTAQQQPQRQTSKLQKAPPTKLTSGKLQPTRLEPKTVALEPQSINIPPLDRDSPKTIDNVGTALIAQSELGNSPSPEFPLEKPVHVEPPKDSRRGILSPVRDVLTSSSSSLKPEKLKISKHRMPLDESDSSPDNEQPPKTLLETKAHNTPASSNKSARERLSESPIEVASSDQIAKPHTPTLVVDTSSREDPLSSPASLISSPELVEAPHDNDDREETPASTAQSSANTPTWSDANLRAYLEDDSDIRDLLVVVHDKSDVKPADPNHPLVKNLFKEENRKLGEISTQLDDLLGDWLIRKSKTTKA